MTVITWFIVALCLAEVIFISLLIITWRSRPKQEPPPDLLIMPNGDVVHTHQHPQGNYTHHHAGGELSHTHPYE